MKSGLHFSNNGGRNGINCCRLQPIQYNLHYHIVKNNSMTRCYVLWTITWPFSHGCEHEINNVEKYSTFAGHFDGHGNAPV